ncbi:MAG TPA: ATP-binding protein [Myxococcales bacterium]|nr:ATP-binding protein [Myxococcales bacterium]
MCDGSATLRPGRTRGGLVVLMCGLPAAGKTTTAERLHARLGGVLIRSCDVYRELGISLPDWVRRTRGFTQDVSAYEQARDAAYARMLSLLECHLTEGAEVVIIDAVHGEPAKRRAVFHVCAAFGADPLLVWCRCDDREETERRIMRRQGRETDPACEASDRSVFDHITRLWEPPSRERCGSVVVPICMYDTQLGGLRWLRQAGGAAAALIEEALTAPAHFTRR